MATLGLRLVSDKDEKDLSLLGLAKEGTSSIPKIILTRFPTVEAVREALGPALDGLPLAVDFVAKQEGPQVLLAAVRKAFMVGIDSLERIERLSNQIRADYADECQRTKVNSLASLAAFATGIVILSVGMGLAVVAFVEVGIVSAVASLVAELLNILFSRRADSANECMDRFNLELLETRRFEKLLAACDELPSTDTQNVPMRLSSK